MNAWEYLAMIDREMMMIDVALMEWQGHLDMAALACLDLTVYETEAQLELPIPLTVKRVPIVRYTEDERKVIGVAELDEQENVIKATVDTDDAEILAMANVGAFSLVDEDPPVLNHREIKAQLRELVSPSLYRNPYEFDGVLPHFELHRDGSITQNRFIEPDESPFFKKEQ